MLRLTIRMDLWRVCAACDEILDLCVPVPRVPGGDEVDAEACVALGICPVCHTRAVKIRKMPPETC